MYEFFTQIGTVLKGVGEAIYEGISSVGTFIKENIITPVSNFVKKIPSYIEQGWDWLKETVGGLFSGDPVKAASGMSKGGVSEVRQVAGSQLDSMGLGSAGDNALGAINGSANPAGAIGGSSVGTINMNTAVPQVTAASRGMTGTEMAKGSTLFGNTADNAARAGLGANVGMPTAVQSAGSTYGKVVEFFKTDFGQFVGQTGASLLANAYQSRQAKAAAKAQEREARRQEQQKREDWLLQNQYQSQKEAWAASRANEVAQVTARNRFAGAADTGFESARTDVPMPQGAF